MLAIGLRRKLGKKLWRCVIGIMATLAVTAFLARLVPDKPIFSILQPHESVTPGRSVIPAVARRQRPQETMLLQEVAEWLQKGLLGPTIVVDQIDGRPSFSVSLSQPFPLLPEHYVHRVASRPLLITGEGGWRPPAGDGRLQEVQEYFTYLKRPQSKCRKLVVMGGSYNCSDTSGDLRDGSKVVCMDPPLDLPPRKDPRSCLTLSFGIFTDATFDEAVSDFNCEIHMFDLLDLPPEYLLEESKHSHFHHVGLANFRRHNYYLNIKEKVLVDSLVGLLINNSLTARPIHILKVDIENDEWSVFEQIVTEPIMDAIGQIAIEIHASDIMKLPPKEHLAFVQRRYDVLRAIESRGFQSVAYWDNKQSKIYHDSSGTAYSTCGEIHFVNSKWYNHTFKEKLKNIGFKFR